VKYEKYKSISILYPSKTLIIRGSQDHALVGPHNTLKGFSNNTAGTLFVGVGFNPGFVFLKGKQG
jgi:hypothetical protein